MSLLLQDLRFGVRSLLRAKTFTTVTIVTLALAIGVNSAIFSMVGLVLLSDLPIDDPERVAFLRMEHPERGIVRSDLSLPDYLDLRQNTSSFEHLAATQRVARVLLTEEEPERVQVLLATSNIFDAWGTYPLLGRGFTEEENQLGAEPVVMLSHGAWVRRFGAAPEIIGRVLEVDGRPATVIGVMTEETEFADMAAIELWMPLPLDPDVERRGRDTFVTGRLADDSSLAAAQEEMGAAFAHLAEAHPAANRGWQLAVKAARDDLVDDAFWVAISFLSLTVFGILLVACSNVATLHLARSSERARELAVRAALGAGRLRIIRQLMTESLCLSLTAAALGIAVTHGIQRGLVYLVGENSGATHLFRMMKIDGQVLGISLILALVAPLVFGLMPALKAARRDLRSTLHEGGRNGSGRGERSRRFLVGFQVAGALALLLTVGVLMRSTLEMRSIDLGYDADAVWTARLDLPTEAYREDAARRHFFARAIEQVRAIPEVEKAAWIGSRPADFGRGSITFRILERPPAREDQLPFAFANVIDPRAADILPMATLAGRGFSSADGEEAGPVALINHETVRRYWGEHTALSDVVGHRVRLGDVGEWVEIVGVVESLIQPSLSNPEMPELFVPLAQRPPQSLALIAELRGDPGVATGAIRAAIRSIDGRQPIGDVRSLGQMYRDAWSATSALEVLLMAFALFALGMAGAGIYGVASFAVSLRTQELGIRMALGAGRGEVMALVVRQSTGVLLVGAGCGLLIGAGLIRLLSSGFAGMQILDPVLWLACAVVFMLVAAVATLIPIQRATGLDPVKALRQE